MSTVVSTLPHCHPEQHILPMCTPASTPLCSGPVLGPGSFSLSEAHCFPLKPCSHHPSFLVPSGCHMSEPIVGVSHICARTLSGPQWVQTAAEEKLVAELGCGFPLAPAGWYIR